MDKLSSLQLATRRVASKAFALRKGLESWLNRVSSACFACLQMTTVTNGYYDRIYYMLLRYFQIKI